MYKFLVDYRFGQMEIAIASNDPNALGKVGYSDTNPALSSMVVALMQTIESNGGLYKGIDPEMASPIDINAALLRGATGSMPPFTFSLIEGELPIEASADGDEQIYGGEAIQFAARRPRKGRKRGKGKKNCNKGINCGGTCISAKKTCRKDNPSEKVKAKAKSKGGGGGGAVDDATLTAAAGDFLVDASNPDVENKVKKIKQFGLTDSEALAIATWISIETYAVKYGETKSRYSLMNQAIYAKGTLPDELQSKIEATNQLAINGYKKIPPITPEVVAAQAKRKGEAFDADAPLQRHMQIPNDPAAFIQRYKDSIGKEVTEATHFATTHKQKLNWIENGANITYEVSPKWDGTGNGRYIDNFKNKASEGEILYPPGSKFRVKNVIDPEPPPKNLIPAKTISDVSETVDFLPMAIGGGKKPITTWQAAYKYLNGSDAFNALPPEVKAIKSKQKILEYLKEQEKIAATPPRFIIQLEEI